MRLRGSLLRALLAGALLVASPLGPLAAGAESANGSAAGSPQTASATPLSAWTGGIDLYRVGVFTTQKTWYWCTAATVQIARNIVFHRTDHTSSGQRAYFDWMRPHDRYRLPLSAGVDAAGWAAGFAHFVDPRYRLHASTSFDAALRSAVTSLRKANLPVALAVDHGNHAWLLTGFTATGDPARTTRFTITSVRVVGPLYGLQSKNGYDMPPDTRLTPAQLRRYFTPWYYAPIRMVWDGTYVSIQPSASAAAQPSTPVTTPSETPSPGAASKPGRSATSKPVLSPQPTAGAASVPGSSAVPAAAVSTSVGPDAPPSGPSAPLPLAPAEGRVAAALDPLAVVTLVGAGLVVAVVVRLAGRRRLRSP